MGKTIIFRELGALAIIFRKLGSKLSILESWGALTYFFNVLAS